MRKSISGRAFRDILTEPSKLDRPSLEEALDAELAKPEEKINTALVEELTDALLRMDGIEADEHRLSFDGDAYTRPRRTTKRRLLGAVPSRLRALVSFCIVLVVLFAVNTLSTVAFDFNIASELATWTKQSVIFHYAAPPETEGEINPSTLYDLLQKNMSDVNYATFLWPSELPPSMELDYMNVDAAPDRLNIAVGLKRDGDIFSINIVNQSTDGADAEPADRDFEIKGNFTSGSCRVINGRTVYLLSNRKVNQLCYMDEYNTYVLTTTYGMDVLESIFASM